MTDCGRRPSPRVAYDRWVAACADAGWHPGQAVEQVSLADGLGRVPAAAVHARWPSPRFSCAAMDGIAVAADSLAGDGHAGDGHVNGRLGDGGQLLLRAPAFSCVDTGDPMPAGTDTVVERELVELRDDGSALVSGSLATGPASRGRNVRSCGEDFQAGQLLIPSGRRLRPADLGAAAAAGYATLTVARRPVIAIIPTGDEVRPVGSVLEPGEFTDSNSLMLAARASQAGAVPVVTGVQPDDPDVLAAAAREAACAADLVLIIAGSSRGRGDFTAAVLAQVGGLVVHGVAVRPGHPALLGHVKPGAARYAPSGGAGYPPPGAAVQPAGTVPAIGVPGYPLAAAVIFELFAVPLIARLTRLARLDGRLAPETRDTPDTPGLPDRTPVRARLGCDWTSPPDVEDWIPVSLDPALDTEPNTARDRADPVAARIPVAVPSKGHGAGAISRLVRADAWWPIPIGQGRFARGDVIEVLPIHA